MGDALILREVVLSISSRSSALAELILPHLGFLPVNGLQADLPDSDDAMMEIIFPRIELTPTGGDAVRSGLPEEVGFALTGQFSLNPDLDIEVAGTIDANQIETIAPDEGDKQRWVTNGSEARLAIDHFTLNEHVSEGSIATITVTDMKSVSLFGGPGQVEHDFTADKIGFTLAMAGEEADTTLTGQIAGLELTAGHDHPEGRKPIAAPP